MRQGEIAKAAEMAEALAAANRDDPVIQDLLGSVRMAQKRLPEAETIFRRVLDARPDFAPSSLNLIQVLVAENKEDEARVMLKGVAERKLDNY